MCKKNNNNKNNNKNNNYNNIDNEFIYLFFEVSSLDLFEIFPKTSFLLRLKYKSLDTFKIVYCPSVALPAGAPLFMSPKQLKCTKLQKVKTLVSTIVATNARRMEWMDNIIT